jgi:hypothetical protein
MVAYAELLTSSCFPANLIPEPSTRFVRLPDASRSILATSWMKIDAPLIKIAEVIPSDISA